MMTMTTNDNEFEVIENDIQSIEDDDDDDDDIIISWRYKIQKLNN